MSWIDNTRVSYAPPLYHDTVTNKNELVNISLTFYANGINTQAYVYLVWYKIVLVISSKLVMTFIGKIISLHNNSITNLDELRFIISTSLHKPINEGRYSIFFRG